MRCARCRRTLTREPIVIEGRGYGEVCAGKVRPADLLTQRKRRAGAGPRRKQPQDERQRVLFHVEQQA